MGNEAGKGYLTKKGVLAVTNPHEKQVRKKHAKFAAKFEKLAYITYV